MELPPRDPVFYVPRDEASSMGRWLFVSGIALGCSLSFVVWAILHVYG